MALTCRLPEYIFWSIFVVTLTMDFQSQIWNNRISGMGGSIDIAHKGCESVIHDHDCDPLVTKVKYNALVCSLGNILPC